MQFTQEDRKKLEDKFFKDPDWAIIRRALAAEIVALEGLGRINVDLPAEDVKCQVKGHQVAQKVLLDFLTSCGILSHDSVAPDEEARFN